MRIEDGKRAYKDAEIPEELHSMVAGLIKADRKKRTSNIEGQKNIEDHKASENYDEKNCTIDFACTSDGGIFPNFEVWPCEFF